MKFPSGKLAHLMFRFALQFKGSAIYVLINFSTPLIFYLTFHYAGTKAAIQLALCVSAFQLLFHLVRRQKPTYFFIISTTFTVLFGGIDLTVATPRFFRLEPFAQNFIIASAFLYFYIRKIPLFSKLMSELPQPLRPKQSLPPDYNQKLILIWIVYLYSKSILFLFLAFTLNLGKLILVRSIIGSGTLLALLIGELNYRKKYLSQNQSKSTFP